MGLFDFSTLTLCIDAGSASTRIRKKEELIFNEPTMLSINHKKGRATGIGNGVQVDEENELIEPVNYVIGDYFGFEIRWIES